MSRGVPVGAQQVAALGAGTIMAYNHHLAYSHGDLDRRMDAERDEGEGRLPAVRAFLRSAQRCKGLEGLLSVTATRSICAFLLPRNAEEADGHALMASVLAVAEPSKAKVTLLHPTIKLLTTDEADMLDVDTRLTAVAVRGESRIALPQEPPGEEAPQPRVVVRFPKESIRGAQKDALMSFERSELGVAMSFRGATGLEKTGIQVIGVSPAQVDPLFKLTVRSSGADSIPPVVRAPRRPGEVPEQLQGRLAAIAQDRLRLHVLMCAGVPEGVTRPLVFDTMQTMWINNPNNIQVKPRMQVRATVHSTSSTCLCGAHGKVSMEERFPDVRFNGKSRVYVGFEMCGKVLQGGAGFTSAGDCPVHLQHRETASFGMGRCLCNVCVVVKCVHDTEEVDPNGGPRTPGQRDGTWFRMIFRNPAVRKEMAAVLAKIAHFDDKSRPFFTAAKRDVCPSVLEYEADKMDRDLSQRLTEIRQGYRGPSAVDLLNADRMALATLREGGVRQSARSDRGGREERLERRVEGAPPLTGEQKALARTHFDLFPSSNASLQLSEDFKERMARKRKKGSGASVASEGSAGSGRSGKSARSALPAGAVGDAAREAEPSAANAVVASEKAGTPSAEQRGQHKPLNGQGAEMYEYADPKGLAELKRQLVEYFQDQGLTAEERERTEWFAEYVKAIEEHYGPPTTEGTPGGRCLHPLWCVYKGRYGMGGRLYAEGHSVGPVWNDGTNRKSSVNLAGAPRELKPFLMGAGPEGAFGKDIDQKNSQPGIMKQLKDRLTLPEGHEVPTTDELEDWCRDRLGYIQHLAETHSLAADADMYPEYQKDVVKKLVIGLMFGGSYRGWVLNTLKREWDSEPKSPKILKMEEELGKLRSAVFASKEWGPWCGKDTARLQKLAKEKNRVSDRVKKARERGKPQEEIEAMIAQDIERSVFARVAQSLENDILTSMRQFLQETGWRELSLIYDGLIVAQRPGLDINFKQMSERILKDTGFVMEVCEKPFHDGPAGEWPRLSLVRG